MEIDKYPNSYSFFVGAIGISIGLMIYGHKVIECIGKKIIVLDFYKGYSA
jgi:phosphate/sulfate permease